MNLKTLTKIFKITGLAFLLLFSIVLEAQILDKNSIIANNAKVVELGNGFIFTEGPTADKKGNVYFTDQPNNKIHIWNATTGKISLFSDAAGRSNGLYFTDKGQLLACADMDNQLWSFDKRGKHTVLVDGFNKKLLNGPNDLWINAEGDVYFTDPLYKRNYWTRDPEMQQKGQYVYCYNPRKDELRIVDSLTVQPNGIVGTLDGKKLYVADIGDNKTYVYDIQKNGLLSNRKLFVEMGSDGMTIDSRGNIYLTGRGVTVFDPQGKKIAHIPIDKDWTANVCFGGKENKTLFITAKEAVYGLEMNVSGGK